MTKNEEAVNNIIDDLFYVKNNKLMNRTSRSNRIKKNVFSGTIRKDGYIIISLNNKRFLGHRIIWRLHYGKWPNGCLDHIDGNPRNNNINNLREVSRRQNQQNLKCHRFGHKLGTCFYNKLKKYAARLKIKHTNFHLGFYNTQSEAHEQYMNACKAIETREFKSAKELRDYLASTNKRAEV